METSRATAGQGLLYHLILQPVRDGAGQRRRALLLSPWWDKHHQSNQKSQEGEGRDKRKGGRQNKCREIKEKEMEANIRV